MLDSVSTGPMTPRAVLRYLPLVLVAVLLAVVAVAAGAGGPRVGTVPAPAPTVTGQATGQSQQEGSPPPLATPTTLPHSHLFSPPAWVLILVAALVIAVVYGAVLLWLLLTVRDAWIFRRRRESEPDGDEPAAANPPGPEQVRAAVAAGIDVLISGDDPRAAVIGCWLRLEDLATRGGVPRLASDVPGDLVARMLSGTLTGDAVDAVRELTGVYRAARYSPHPVPESARDTARAALDRIRAGLSVPVGG
jgi:uncharacterized protein DUF4129